MLKLDNELKAFDERFTVLRGIRLEGARHDLQRDTEAVTQKAFNWAFSNFGWFAQADAKKFGEKPFETRRSAAVPPASSQPLLH